MERSHRVPTNEATPRFRGAASVYVGDTGFDSPHDSAGKVGCRNKTGAHSGARDDADAILAAQDDSRLLAVIDAWPMLSEETRDAIAKLAGNDSDDVDDVAVTSAGKVVSR